MDADSKRRASQKHAKHFKQLAHRRPSLPQPHIIWMGPAPLFSTVAELLLIITCQLPFAPTPDLYSSLFWPSIWNFHNSSSAPLNRTSTWYSPSQSGAEPYSDSCGMKSSLFEIARLRHVAPSLSCYVPSSSPSCALSQALNLFWKPIAVHCVGSLLKNLSPP